MGIEYAPWKASHSLFSMVLINVKATVEKGAFYPAKPYHEDIDFPHICNDHQLVAAKCQWLFVRKVGVSLDSCYEPVACTLTKLLKYWQEHHR